VATLQDQARALRAPWVDAAAERGEGHLALAAGEPAAAGLLGRAATAFDALGYRLDAARARLAEGRALRRSGARVASASAFKTAQVTFAEIGAHPWARQAAHELAPAGAHRSAGADEVVLTATEERIAALVGAGRRNREVAAELFVSVATVEAHLTRIYRKLGVRSRTELTGKIAAGAPLHHPQRPQPDAR
jgi:DNA-binding CsgD family transcriptional regulator